MSYQDTLKHLQASVPTPMRVIRGQHPGYAGEEHEEAHEEAHEDDLCCKDTVFGMVLPAKTRLPGRGTPDHQHSGSCCKDAVFGMVLPGRDDAGAPIAGAADARTALMLNSVRKQRNKRGYSGAPLPPKPGPVPLPGPRGDGQVPSKRCVQACHAKYPNQSLEACYHLCKYGEWPQKAKQAPQGHRPPRPAPQAPPKPAPQAPPKPAPQAPPKPAPRRGRLSRSYAGGEPGREVTPGCVSNCLHKMQGGKTWGECAYWCKYGEFQPSKPQGVAASRASRRPSRGGFAGCGKSCDCNGACGKKG